MGLMGTMSFNHSPLFDAAAQEENEHEKPLVVGSMRAGWMAIRIEHHEI